MSWDELAACRTSGIDPDTWHPDHTDVEAIRVAKLVCRSCPVRQECANEAMQRGEKFGIRAGFRLETERDQLSAYLDLSRECTHCVECGRAFRSRAHANQRCWVCVRGLVDSVPTRRHVESLRNRMTLKEIAEAAGISRETVRGIYRSDRITYATSQALLSVQLDEVPA